MEFTLLTYNVLYNIAYNELDDIIQEHAPDIICLQEVDTDEANLRKLEKNGYKLADYSNSFIRLGKIFGVATFYNQKKIKFINSDIFQVPRSIYEVLLFIIRILRGGNKPRTILKTDFLLKDNGKKIFIHNIHLAVFESNGARVKQMRKMMEFVNLDKERSLIVSGDFNYQPYRRKQLETLMKGHGLSEATRLINYTMKMTNDGKLEEYNLFQRFLSKLIRRFINDRFKVDYIFYRNLKLKEAKRINVRYSDHFPILASFST